MAITATVTRGFTYETGVEVEPSGLNQLGTPTVTVPDDRIVELEDDWAILSVNFAGTPTLTATIGSGDVYTYTYNNPSKTLYRLVGTSTDQFYTGFDGSALSGLVCTRGG